MNICGITLSDTIYNRAVAAADQYGAPRGLVVGLGIIEAGNNAAPPPGDGGCSFGWLQLNVCGGQGAGYTQAQLEDLATNLAIGVGGTPGIAWAYQRYGGPDLARTDWWLVMQRSGHPGYPAGSVAYLWTDQRYARLGNRTAVEFVECAVAQLDRAPVITRPAPSAPSSSRPISFTPTNGGEGSSFAFGGGGGSVLPAMLLGAAAAGLYLAFRSRE